MSTILAIDPGNRESAYALIDHDYRPLQIGKVANDELADMLPMLSWAADLIAIEQIGHYGTGMPAGRDVFDTCRWIGRFEQIILYESDDIAPELVLRAKVKTHLCGVAKAKDSNVIQALVDRFTPGQPNRGKGTKAAPGWFHGFARDIWQSYALAVYFADLHQGEAGAA